MQQKKRKEIMDELKRRQETGKDIIIFRNKIIPRIHKNFH